MWDVRAGGAKSRVRVMTRALRMELIKKSAQPHWLQSDSRFLWISPTEFFKLMLMTPKGCSAIASKPSWKSSILFRDFNHLQLLACQWLRVLCCVFCHAQEVQWVAQWPQSWWLKSRSILECHCVFGQGTWPQIAPSGLVAASQWCVKSAVKLFVTTVCL